MKYFIKRLVMFWINNETEQIINLTNCKKAVLQKFKTFIVLIYKQEVMKTINNIQQVAQKTIAIVVSFILISFTISAQDFWEELVSISHFEELVFAFADNTAASKAVSSNENLSSSRFLDFFEMEIEE